MSGLYIDIQGKYRDSSEYKTTLSHKANHKFHKANTVFQQDLNHPVLGPIGGLRAITDIEQDEEIFVNYGYKIHSPMAPPWYREEFLNVYGKCELSQDVNTTEKVNMRKIVNEDYCKATKTTSLHHVTK